MKAIRPAQVGLRHIRHCVIALFPLTLLACGGDGNGDPSGASTLASSGTVSSTSSTSVVVSPLSSTAASAAVTPAFYTVPVVLTAPADIDGGSSSASAHRPPATQTISAELAAVSRAQLTPQAIARYAAAAATPSAAGSTVVTTYTPAQIRAAYGLPALPSSWSGLSASVSAQMGAGQTIYIVDAMSDPNIAAELATFNQKFGLPSCASSAIAPTTSLPIAAAGTSGCQFSVVYSNSNGAMSSSAPAYDSGWATEIALDVQWAHATAPLARIILIEAPSASNSSLLAAISLANAMGPGIVSMSFGAAEGAWTSSVDSAFSNAHMTYVAATGDSGTGVEWPSVSPNVLAVGGTDLTYNGSARVESAWADTGGGTSQFTTVPGYQTSSVPGMGTPSMRAVADVSFNADPYTGQYVAVIPPGSATASWYSIGGTSLSTPQWAGIAAVGNALRAHNSLGVLGLMQPLLYGSISTSASLYASAFYDITTGSDGSCSTCSAHVGYDRPSGLGTPNVTSLLSMLSTSKPTQAPVVSPLTVKGIAGSALSFTMAATAPDAITWSLVNAPKGMSINASGQVSWPQPVAGSYAVSVTAKDAVTGLSGTAVATITIVTVTAPTVVPATIVAQAGQALTYQVDVSASDSVTFSMTNAPSGMTISSSGLITWRSPVAGTYAATVTATDVMTGRSGSAPVTVKITAASSGPVISTTPVRGVAGQPVSGSVGIADPGARYVTVTIKGAPAGMSFSVSGQSILMNWARPVAGSYTLVFTAVDSAGLSSQASVAVTIGN